MDRLTLSEMAGRYGKTPKTFSKYVREYGVPHERIGRSMLFDAGKVQAFLEALAGRPKNAIPMPKRLPTTIKRHKVLGKSKFVDALCPST